MTIGSKFRAGNRCAAAQLVVAAMLLAACSSSVRPEGSIGDAEAGRNATPSTMATVTSTGATLAGPDGTVLLVPPGTVVGPTNGQISEVSNGYDIHITGPWQGYVIVAIPRAPDADGYAQVMGHYVDGNDQPTIEPSVVVGNFLIARVSSLSVFSNLKCLTRIMPSAIVTCIGKDQIKKEIAKKAVKKAADPITCGDLTDIIGNVFGSEPCHAGETEEDIRRAQEIWKQQQEASSTSGATQTSANPSTNTSARNGSAPSIIASGSGGQMMVQVAQFPLGLTYYFCHNGSGYPTGGTITGRGSVTVSSPNQSLGALCSGSGNSWIGFQATNGQDYYSNQVGL